MPDVRKSGYQPAKNHLFFAQKRAGCHPVLFRVYFNTFYHRCRLVNPIFTPKLTIRLSGYHPPDGSRITIRQRTLSIVVSAGWLPVGGLPVGGRLPTGENQLKMSKINHPPDKNLKFCRKNHHPADKKVDF